MYTEHSILPLIPHVNVKKKTSVFEWDASNSRENRLSCSRLNSSPISQRNHIDALRSNTEWKNQTIK